MKNSPNILNVTLPLKQDLATQIRLQEVILDFETKLFPIAAKALMESQMVHYARFVLIGTQYLQILTEYDNDFKEYTAWFAKNLAPFFSQLFQLVEGALSPEDVKNPDKLFAYIKSLDIPCLGGVAFSAYGDLKVGEIQQMVAAKKKVEGP
jgi:hypothetical protein